MEVNARPYLQFKLRCIFSNTVCTLTFCVKTQTNLFRNTEHISFYFIDTGLKHAYFDVANIKVECL